MLSQTLGGCRDRLSQRDPRRFLSPDLVELGPLLNPAEGPQYLPTAAPAAAATVPFSPVQAGLLSLDKLWVVDDFGQTYDVLGNLSVHPELGGAVFGADLTPAPALGWRSSNLDSASPADSS